MPAIVYVGEGAIEVQRVDVPELGPGQVRIAVSHCGICGTDRHLFLGEFPSRPPVTIGHEFAGIVEAVGSDVTGFKIGDREYKSGTLGMGGNYFVNALREAMAVLERPDNVDTLVVGISPLNVRPLEVSEPFAAEGIGSLDRLGFHFLPAFFGETGGIPVAPTQALRLGRQALGLGRARAEAVTKQATQNLLVGRRR